MSDSPILARWSGLGFEPLARFQETCDQRYVVGEVYYLEASLGRSKSSHNHYFACIRSAWENLPDSLALEYPTPEALRAKALIKAGYAKTTRIVCGTRKDALTFASYVRKRDEGCIVAVTGQVVMIFEPLSQSHAAMGKKEFQESKQKVLEVIAGIIDISVDDLARNTG